MADRYSDELDSYENASDGTHPVVDAPSLGGRMRSYKGTITLDGAETNGMEVEIARLYHGQVLRPTSKLFFEALGSDVTVSVGHDAYTKRDGTAVVKDVDAFLAATTATSAGSADIAAAIEGFKADVDPDEEYISIIAVFGQATAINTTAGQVAVAHLDVVGV